MKLDERHLIQLAAVINAGGVTEGAELLGMTQPAVSRTLALLEKRLGEPLFVKGRRPLRPTPFGRALADHGQAMLEPGAFLRQGPRDIAEAGRLAPRMAQSQQP